MNLNTIDLMVEGIPFEWLRKDRQKGVCSQLLRDEQQKIYDLLPGYQQSDATASNIRLLTELLAAVKDNLHILKEHQAFWVQALPFFLSYPRDDGTGDSSLNNKRRKMLIKAVKAREFFSCFQAYLSRVEYILKRSNPENYSKDSVLTVFEGEADHVGEMLKKDIEYAGKQFFDYLNWKNVRQINKPESRDAVRKLFFQDPWLFPLIPALYSLDVLSIVLKNKRRSKAALLQPDENGLDIWSFTHRDLVVRTKGARELYLQIAKRVSEIRGPYITAAYPYYPWKPLLNQRQRGRLLGFQHEYDDSYWEEQGEATDTKPFLRSSVAIKLPICHYRGLVFDLAKVYDLSSAELLDLLHKAPNYLYKGTPEWNTVSVSHADEVIEVLRVFRKLSEPELYMREKTAWLSACKPLVASLKKAGFTYSAPADDLESRIFSLLKEYFYFRDVSELMFYMSAPIALGASPLKELPTLFKTVRSSLQESAEVLYFHVVDRLNSRNIAEQTPRHIKQFRREVLQTMTLDDAIATLREHFSLLALNFSDSKFQKSCRDSARRFLDTYKQSNDYEVNVYNSVTTNSGNLEYFYLGLLRESLNLVCSVGIDNLIRLFLSVGTDGGARWIEHRF